MGPVLKSRLLYQNDRSSGIAFVTYRYQEDAYDAIEQLNDTLSRGNTVRVTLASSSRQANQPAGRSLFERIENPMSAPRARSRSPDRRRRSRSPDRRQRQDAGQDRERRGNMNNPPPKNIDRYVPGSGGGGGGGGGGRERGPRRGSPRRQGGPGRGGGESRRGGDRRQARDNEGHQMVGGRPRKTADELDAEMDDYFKNNQAEDTGKNAGAGRQDEITYEGKDVLRFAHGHRS